MVPLGTVMSRLSRARQALRATVGAAAIAGALRGKRGDMNCADVAALSPLYQSGELDPGRTASLVAHLKRCPACARAIELESAFDARLRAGILGERVDSAALEQRIHKAIAPSLFRSIWMYAAVPAIALMAVLTYATLPAFHTPRLYVDAAEDHRDEIVQKQPRRWATDAAALDALAQSQQVPLLRIGYRLERARLCRLAGLRYVHLVYADGTREFSVFIRQGDTLERANRGQVYAADTTGEHVACFETGRFTALFVADDSRQDAVALAHSAVGAL